MAWELTPRVLRRVVVSAANPTIRVAPSRQHAPNIVRTRFTTIAAIESSTLRMLVGFATLTTTLHDNAATVRGLIHARILPNIDQAIFSE